MDLDELLKFMTKMEASDLHIKPMRPPLLRIKGKLIPIKTDPLPPPAVQEMLTKILKPKQLERLEQTMACDLGYGVPGVARFRGNIYMQRGTYSAVFRRIPYQILSLEELELPGVIKNFADYPAGLVVVTGPTGSGKSTTLAALIKHVTETQQVHIVTIEDPIEFLFQDGMAAVSQREVGTDTVSFAEALKNSLRQDPDVILVGEMRDATTIETVLTAAETGHLVFSTLHTNNAAQTIDRIIDTIPADRQGQVRSQLALVLRAVISLKLVEKADGSGLTAAVEIMINSPKIAKHIEMGETKEIVDELEGSVGYFKMQSMNQSLIALLVNGAITYEKAMELSAEPEDLSLKLRKLFPRIEEAASKGAAPTASDFAEIQELAAIKREFEQQETKWKTLFDSKDREIEDMEREIAELSAKLAASGSDSQAKQQQIARHRQENEKIRTEANRQINVLNERIRDANQRILETGRMKPASESGSGFFKR
jgi:twitching motility protein PilT